MAPMPRMSRDTRIRPLAVALSVVLAVGMVTTAETSIGLGPRTDPGTARTSEGATEAPPEIISFTPARLLETREGRTTVDGRQAAGGRRAAGTTTAVTVTDRGGVSSDGIEAVVLNVTAVRPAAAGFLTIHPCDQPRPLASSLNYASSTLAIANEVVAGVSANGTVCIYTSAAVDLVADVVGEVPGTSSIRAVGPGRLFDSRPAGQTVDGSGRPDNRLRPGSTTRISVAGRGGVDASARTAILNITAVAPTEPGFFTVFDCGRRPLASSLNHASGEVIAVEVIAGLSSDGSVCIYSLAETDLVVDVVGQVTQPTDYRSLSPARLFETRRDRGTFDGVGRLGRELPPDTVTEIAVAGRGRVPATGVGSVVLNIAVVRPRTAGYVTVFPCGNEPVASSLNHGTGQTIANEIVTAVSDIGSVCVVNSALTHLVVDVVGFVPD